MQQAKMLTIFIDETDQYQDLPLYEYLLRRFLQLGFDGATVHRGIMGFGRHHHLHGRGLFGVSDDRPVVVTVVAEEPKLLGMADELRQTVREGLIVMSDVTVF